MSEVQKPQTEARKGPGLLIGAVAVAIILGLCGGLLYGKWKQDHTALIVADYAKASLVKMTASAPGSVAPMTGFNDADGQPTTLAAFKGKIVVANLWATWCAPCRLEMPTLAALQKRYAGTDLVVVPISLDRDSDVGDAKAFIAEHPPLKLFHDGKFAMPAAMKEQGLPATVIFDREGNEIARVRGEAKWDSPEAIALFDRLLKN
jgi:thiol-disulfide isomerase/thioredoxin